MGKYKKKTSYSETIVKALVGLNETSISTFPFPGINPLEGVNLISLASLFKTNSYSKFKGILHDKGNLYSI